MPCDVRTGAAPLPRAVLVVAPGIRTPFRPTPDREIFILPIRHFTPCILRWQSGDYIFASCHSRSCEFRRADPPLHSMYAPLAKRGQNFASCHSRSSELRLPTRHLTCRQATLPHWQYNVLLCRSAAIGAAILGKTDTTQPKTSDGWQRGFRT